MCLCVPCMMSARRTAQFQFIYFSIGLQNASMAIGSLAVKSSREEQISFSFTIISSTISILTKRPVTSPVLFQFLWPFSWQLWVVIIAFYIVAGGALWVMSRYDVTQNGSEQQFDLKESIWYSFNLFLGGTKYISIALYLQVAQVHVFIIYAIHDIVYKNGAHCSSI